MADLVVVPGFARYVAELTDSAGTAQPPSIAGGASLRQCGGIAQLCGSATLPGLRRRGVQSALLAARLADAARAGCDLAVITTQPGSKSQNAQRAGFTLLYSRAILVRQDQTDRWISISSRHSSLSLVRGSITRAAEQVHLSQPAVSAYIKALEDTLGLTLFEHAARHEPDPRWAAPAGQAEQTLAVHQELMDEATRIKGKLTGKLRLGASSSAGSSSGHAAIGRLLTRLAERCPDVEVVPAAWHISRILAGLRGGSLDAGFWQRSR